ncbi:hypothetical protein [Halalkalicoccus jeotgali]|uniref:hypothetical protein n=1 Tax=Halalkalicoccus jeotgali TaxID=413810 RepID=UPI0012DDB25C|nr:hypothetical protein [Halalkalicoccus jeotgali]
MISAGLPVPRTIRAAFDREKMTRRFRGHQPSPVPLTRAANVPPALAPATAP